MKQSLQLRVSQHLALTPQLQQSIRLLQLSTLELNAEIEQALQDNPLLERDGDQAGFSQTGDLSPVSVSAAESREQNEAAEASDEEGWGTDFSARSGQRDPNDDDSDSGEMQTAVTSLREHLGAQLALTPLSDRLRVLVSFLIESLSEDGYLTQPLDELLELLVAEVGDEREALRDDLALALEYLQSFDPPGIGARDTRECLALQLENQMASSERDLALQIVDRHLEQLAARDFAHIKKALGCTDDQQRAALALIRSLNPRPGAQYAPPDTRYVTPDVTVRKLRGAWIVSLNNEAMPRLRINRLYADILRNQQGGGHAGLAAQLQEAKWLIKNVQQRFDTILRVSQAIVDRQRAFFEHGAVAMRPLTLREIAEVVGLHESTISRVTTQKYLASPRGVFELKYFFGSHVATDSGGAASSTAIRELIRQLVSAEDGTSPLTDARIAEILGEQGIVVARRTIAKYRDLLGIPPVNLRKTL
ncbi:MAG: RNA polymerase factor sigma-54 [Betaproteobacteria bacterium HGW-Betaproteobacteria-11]|nr:MAG: RNA polymerase factor sigma-54 [Betaproteobacteria bacterium HGW-Betaproteobacteria-11]